MYEVAFEDGYSIENVTPEGGYSHSYEVHLERELLIEKISAHVRKKWHGLRYEKYRWAAFLIEWEIRGQPLNIREVAEEIGVNQSTLGVVKFRVLQELQRVFPEYSF